MKNIVQLFSVVAAVGLVLSIASHIAGLMGRPGPLGDSAIDLQFGIFAVWIPTMFASKHVMKDNPQKNFWKLALRGCPTWMKYMTYGFGIYGIYILPSFSLASQAPLAPGTVRRCIGWCGPYDVRTLDDLLLRGDGGPVFGGTALGRTDDGLAVSERALGASAREVL